MASGTIIGQTRTSDASLPVENATVACYERGTEGKLRLLAVRKTNANGLTTPIILDTPAQEMSLRPEAGDGSAPFRTVSVSADSPGYERITANGVQVFAGVVTYQNFLMIPLPAPMENVAPEEIFATPAQTL